MLVLGPWTVLALILAAWQRAPSPDHGSTSTPQYRSADFPPLKGEYDLFVSRILDGDTVEAFFLVPIQGRGRLYGINAPEMSTAGGPPAKAHLATLVETGRLYRAQLKGREKYGGTLLILLDADGNSINSQMVQHGFAVEYLP